MSVKDTDKGFKKLVKSAKDTGKRIVTVGVHADAGQSADGKASIQEIATIHEFGLGVPQRSFIGAWADENEAKNQARIKKLALAVKNGKITEEQALDQFGLLAVGEIQQRIADGIPPENAPSTVARKGSSTPLIDTGSLRSSIRHKVESK